MIYVSFFNTEKFLPMRAVVPPPPAPPRLTMPPVYVVPPAPRIPLRMARLPLSDLLRRDYRHV